MIASIAMAQRNAPFGNEALQGRTQHEGVCG